MKASADSRVRFGDPAALDAARPAARRLVIEHLDAPPGDSAALLSVCVVAAPVVTTLAVPLPTIEH